MALVNASQLGFSDPSERSKPSEQTQSISACLASSGKLG